MTRPGVLPAPTEPGALWRSDWPCVLGPPRKLYLRTPTGESASLRLARYFYRLTRFEDAGIHSLAQLYFGNIVHAHLSKMTEQLLSASLQVSGARLVQAFHRFETKLYALIAVVVNCFYLGNRAGSHFKGGYAVGAPVLMKNLRGAYLFAYQCMNRHSRSL